MNVLYVLYVFNEFLSNRIGITTNTSMSYISRHLSGRRGQKRAEHPVEIPQ